MQRCEGRLAPATSNKAFLTRQDCFDAIDIYTKTCDLRTSLEYLLVLTAVKQKMRDPESATASFEERLQGALMSSAKEHGKDLADLNLRFCILQTTGFLIKPGFLLRSPTVRSAEELGKLRALLEPFRRYGRCPFFRPEKLVLAV